MDAHEEWCCRSPESPCAKEGGCSGSCNCDAELYDESAFCNADNPADLITREFTNGEF